MTMSSGGGGAMYAFLACTASQFMTPTVITVKRQTTIFQLGALFEQHDFNAFPVMENGQVLGTCHQIRFPSHLRLHEQPNGPSLRRSDEPSGCGRNDRGNCACRSNFAINAGSPTDG